MLPLKSTILLFEATMLLVLHSSGWLMANADQNGQSELSVSATDGQVELPNAGDYITFWLVSNKSENGTAEYNNCRWNVILYTDGNFRFSAFL